MGVPKEISADRHAVRFGRAWSLTIACPRGEHNGIPFRRRPVFVILPAHLDTIISHAGITAVLDHRAADRFSEAHREETLSEPVAPQQELPVSVLVLARDEEVNLPDALHSAVGWAAQVLVVLDPRTKDRSREVATALGAQVVEHLFESHSAQREWALHSGHLSQPWIFILDADERVSPALRRDVAGAIARPGPRVAFAVRSRFIFYGRWMRRSWYGTWSVRLFRAGRLRYEAREVHENVLVDGPIGDLDGDLIHNDFKDMDAWIAKHNRYATLEVAEVLRPGARDQVAGRLLGSRVERRRFIKERLWNRIPFRPFWFFVYLYFVRLGVLEGSVGFRFCAMHAIFDGFTTAKLWEARWLSRHPVRNYYRDLLEEDLRLHPEGSSSSEH